MGRAYEFRISSRLAASPDAVWASIGSMQGVNRELFPLARLTYPRGRARIVPGVMPLGRRAFRSWILLFGLVPLDYDDLTFVELYPGGGFLEVSTMLSQREWRHRRTLQPADGGCLLSDEVRLVPRLAVTGPLYRAAFALVFRLRHRNLLRMFAAGGRAGA